jgi:Fe2+ transport system protein FeoA
MNDQVEQPLSTISSGTRVAVVRLDGGEGFRSKVISMGLIPGKEFSVQSYSRKGPPVVQIDGSRVALGRELAERVIVRPV